MSAKQDRQGVRSAAELIQRLNLGQRFADVLGVATDARTTAEEAKKLIEEGMTQEEIFNILTNNGQSQGLYRGEDGELYINASYIVAGILNSFNGKTKFNLETGEITSVDDLGYVVKICDGNIELFNNEGQAVLKMGNLGFGGVITFKSGENGSTVGRIAGSETGLLTTIKKIVLFSGDVSAGNTFDVLNTDSYDLFAVKLGTTDATEDTVVLAYKNGNTINGVGGWAGTASLSKELFFVSVTFDGDTWTLVDARKQGIYNAGSITSGTALNIKEVVGVI